MRFEEDMSRRIGDIMTKENLITAPVGTSLAEAKEILRKHRIEKLPLVDKEGNLQGLITIKDIEKATKYPNSAKDGNGRLLVAAAVGVTHDMTDRSMPSSQPKSTSSSSIRLTAIPWASSIR